MRLESTKPAMVFLPLSVVAYAWLAQKHVHVASLCTALFFIGFFSMSIRRFHFLSCFFFPDPQKLFTTDGSIRVHSRTSLMPTLAAPLRLSPQTAASAALQPAFSQRPQSPFRTRWATAGCTRSGRGSWSCVSSCFCWYGCVGARGGRPPTNARGSRANSLGSESALGHERATGRSPIITRMQTTSFTTSPSPPSFFVYLAREAARTAKSPVILYLLTRHCPLLGPETVTSHHNDGAYHTSYPVCHSPTWCRVTNVLTTQDCNTVRLSSTNNFDFSIAISLFEIRPLNVILI
jgi:hypothetical protein